MLRTRAPHPIASALAGIVFLASGCGSNLSPRASLGPDPAVSGPTPAVEAPAIRTVTVSRAGHDLVVRLELDPTDAAATALTSVGSGRDGWTFQLGFDTDRDRTSGDASGAELATVLDARGNVSMLAWSAGVWQPVATAPLEWSGGAIQFRLDATRFAAPLADAVVSAESYAVAATADGGADVAAFAWRLADPDREPVPSVRRIRSEVRGDSLIVRAQLAAGEHGEFYDPAHPGGWSLQLLLDTGEDGIGYWQGYDYIVRGVEWSNGRFVVRRITLDPNTPGGWGPETGTAGFTLHPRDFVLTIPLAALGGDDGRADFALETYLTVACPNCAGGVTEELSADTFGATLGARAHHGMQHLAAALDMARLGIGAPPAFDASAR